MSEKDDIMGLAFLVGGSINDLKKNTLGDGKFIHQNLPNPVDFVKSVAAQDISKVVAEGRNEAIQSGKMAPPVSPLPPIPTSAGVPPSSDANQQAIVQLLRDILLEIRKVTTRMGL